MTRILFLIFACVVAVCPAERLELKGEDVVAFVGGGDVVAAQHTGHFESLLAAEYPGTRFRNLGWEGDTVFSQPRDYNFPPLREHLRKTGATVIFVQFGRMEVFAEGGVKEFSKAYEKLLTDLRQITSRLVLVTPAPFERGAEPLPDASMRNADLGKIAGLIREAGANRRLRVLDLYSALRGREERITEDGVQITRMGHGLMAVALAKEMGLKGSPSLATNGCWKDPGMEELRQSIIAKNRLWFDYWRPQNWAFLGGDRTEQPSSRDHKDPKSRWFPDEIEKFRELIAEREKEIELIAERIAKD